MKERSGLGVLALAVSLALSGCIADESASLTVGITDAPIDLADIQSVAVTVTALEIKPKQGDAIRFSFTPQVLVLSDLQDGLRALLIDTASVPVGDYVWARLYLDADADGDATDSFVVTGSGTFELVVPSNANTGLKINTPFSIGAGQTQDLTIDFDLRKSLHLPQSGSNVYVLRPTLRLVRTRQSASLTGTVSTTLLSDLGCTFNNNEVIGAAVYVFDGAGVTPDDVDGIAPDPLASAKVKYRGGLTAYRYEVAYLPQGDYTAALTCDAALDDPLVDESQTTPLVFYGTSDVRMTAGTNTALDFN